MEITAEGRRIVECTRQSLQQGVFDNVDEDVLGNATRRYADRSGSR
jgi:hypothetical protein